MVQVLTGFKDTPLMEHISLTTMDMEGEPALKRGREDQGSPSATLLSQLSKKPKSTWLASPDTTSSGTPYFDAQFCNSLANSIHWETLYKGFMFADLRDNIPHLPAFPTVNH